MDQIHLPDPVKEDIDLLQKENSALCNEVIDLEKELKILREEHEKCHYGSVKVEIKTVSFLYSLF